MIENNRQNGQRNTARKYSISEERYREMRQNFMKADVSTRAEIASALAQSLSTTLSFLP